MALLQARVGRPQALEFDRVVRPHLEVCWVDEALHRAAVDRVASFETQPPSLVDCISFEVMARRGLAHAFAFDGHFDDAGFRPLQSAADVDQALEQA